MARTASYIDFKRIQKNSRLYTLSQDAIENIYRGGLLTISSNDSYSFCYPVKYWDGILLRYNSSNIINSIDMLIDLSERLPGRIYIPDNEESMMDLLLESGFNEYLKLYNVYKRTSFLPHKDGIFNIIDYSKKYDGQIKYLEDEAFSFPRIADYNCLSDFMENSNSRIKLCTLDNKLCGFCLYIFKPEVMYFYIVKIYVSIYYRRMGAGILLLKAIVDESKKHGYCPIFSDVFSDEPQPFLNYADFTTWGESQLLIRK